MKINELFKEPGDDTPGCDFINLTDEDIEIIETDERIQKMIGNGRIVIDDNKMWYFDDDASIVELLGNTMGINEIVNFSSFLNENHFQGYDDITEDLVERIKLFVLDWWGKDIDTETISLDGDFVIESDETTKYKFTIKIEKE